jgi:hypothetical protein
MESTEFDRLDVLSQSFNLSEYNIICDIEPYRTIKRSVAFFIQIHYTFLQTEAV